MPTVGGGMNGIQFHDDGTMTGAACWRADGVPVALAVSPFLIQPALPRLLREEAGVDPLGDEPGERRASAPAPLEPGGGARGAVKRAAA